MELSLSESRGDGNQMKETTAKLEETRKDLDSTMKLLDQKELECKELKARCIKSESAFRD